ncbi:unnamed protein product, partial [Hapterophycus canaliculatus]
KALASSLTHLDARDNRIAGPVGAHAPHLAALGRLKSLVLASPSRRGGAGGGGQPSNPLCVCGGYRRDVFAAAARSLQTLDGRAADEHGAPDAHGATAERGESGARRGAPRSDGERGSVAAAGGILGGAPASLAADVGRAGLARAAAGTVPSPLPSPEGVPVMPRFDALAGRFRRRRSRGRGGGGRGQPMVDRGGGRWQGGDGDGERMSGARSAEDHVPDGDSDQFESSLADSGWGEASNDGDYDDNNDAPGESRNDTGRADGGGAIRRHPEEAAARVVVGRKGRSRGEGGETRSRVGGDAGARGSGDGDALLPFHGEDAAEEQGLLSRLRSVAQEARLEVMDSRLQDLHAAEARRAAAAAAAVEASAAAAASRRGVASSARRQGVVESGPAGTARDFSRSNPWARQQASQPGATARRVMPRNLRSAGSTAGFRSNRDAVGDRPVRPT